MAQLYGCNDMTTGRPSLMQLATALLAYPLYVVQVLFLLTWRHDIDMCIHGILTQSRDNDLRIRGWSCMPTLLDLVHIGALKQGAMT